MYAIRSYYAKLLSVYSVNQHTNQPMNSLKTICNYFYGCYIGVKTEQLRVCCLDDNLHIVSCSVVQDGGVNAIPINVRKIVEITFRSNCSMIIIAHNHPNGVPIPSDSDVNATRQFRITSYNVCYTKLLRSRIDRGGRTHPGTGAAASAGR